MRIEVLGSDLNARTLQRILTGYKENKTLDLINIPADHLSEALERLSKVKEGVCENINLGDNDMSGLSEADGKALAQIAANTKEIALGFCELSLTTLRAFINTFNEMKGGKCEIINWVGNDFSDLSQTDAAALAQVAASIKKSFLIECNFSSAALQSFGHTFNLMKGGKCEMISFSDNNFSCFSEADGKTLAQIVLHAKGIDLARCQLSHAALRGFICTLNSFKEREYKMIDLSDNNLSVFSEEDWVALSQITFHTQKIILENCQVPRAALQSLKHNFSKTNKEKCEQISLSGNNFSDLSEADGTVLAHVACAQKISLLSCNLSSAALRGFANSFDKRKGEKCEIINLSRNDFSNLSEADGKALAQIAVNTKIFFLVSCNISPAALRGFGQAFSERKGALCEKINFYNNNFSTLSEADGKALAQITSHTKEIDLQRCKLSFSTVRRFGRTLSEMKGIESETISIAYNNFSNLSEKDGEILAQIAIRTKKVHLDGNGLTPMALQGFGATFNAMKGGSCEQIHLCNNNFSYISKAEGKTVAQIAAHVKTIDFRLCKIPYAVEQHFCTNFALLNSKTTVSIEGMDISNDTKEILQANRLRQSLAFKKYLQTHYFNRFMTAKPSEQYNITSKKLKEMPLDGALGYFYPNTKSIATLSPLQLGQLFRAMVLPKHITEKITDYALYEMEPSQITAFNNEFEEHRQHNALVTREKKRNGGVEYNALQRAWRYSGGKKSTPEDCDRITSLSSFFNSALEERPIPPLKDGSNLLHLLAENRNIDLTYIRNIFHPHPAKDTSQQSKKKYEAYVSKGKRLIKMLDEKNHKDKTPIDLLTERINVLEIALAYGEKDNELAHCIEMKEIFEAVKNDRDTQTNITTLTLGDKESYQSSGEKTVTERLKDKNGNVLIQPEAKESYETPVNKHLK